MTADTPFRVLYREFLFRMVDLELIAPQGDMGKLLGQFGGLLVFLSLGLSLLALRFDSSRLPRPQLLVAAWGGEHIQIATTMLVVGLFAVLAWDSTFPDRRDVLVLAPLPLRARTLFLAKVSAAATALSLTVAALNAVPAIAWAVALAPPSTDPLDMILTLAIYRMFATCLLTALAAGAFTFCCVLGVQGLAAQLLPRRPFLRVSSFLQMAAFCFFLCMYFLQPSLATPSALTAPQNQPLLLWLPSYWFLGLFQSLNGSPHPALLPLAGRAWMGIAVAASGAAVAYALSYFRTLRKIVEEPDIVPSARGFHWLPPFGNPLQTAVTQFSIRTMLRSRQHRVILAFYLGLGFAIDVLFLKNPGPRPELLSAAADERWQQLGFPLVVCSVVMMGFWAVGTRLVFAMPLELRANWIFRIVPLRGAPECLAASRRALYLLTALPVGVVAAAVFFSLWPWQRAAVHVAVLVLLSLILAELGLHKFLKLPFTCSYLPGKTNFHLMFLLYFALILALLISGAQAELHALVDPQRSALMLSILGLAAAAARWRASALARSELAQVRFDEAPEPAVFVLDIHKDGVTPLV